jgi:hypothetical protein
LRASSSFRIVRLAIGWARGQFDGIASIRLIAMQSI